ncbi:MAG: winged helix-turn-helix transcriptional regulator [Armatimonadetes bacterium]|nr:winged helix-turn-helix transcriptional regulator [Armatimonadota bacterium]
MPPEMIGPRVAAVYEVQSAWLEPRLRKIGVSWGTFQLLSAVSGSGQNASQIEVAKRLGVTAATLSESVYSHVQRGLLEQAASRKDRRVKVLRLTDSAKTLMRQIRKYVNESETVLSHGLTEKETTQLVALLDKVLDNVP